MKTPGYKTKPFYIKFDGNYFKRGDVLHVSSPRQGIQIEVIKVYKFNLWRRVLNFFGIPFKMFGFVKVKEI